MPVPDTPPGWNCNPSGWHERLPALALALTGFGIATYLGLYQLGLVRVLWEPFFSDGSHRILKESTFARMLPVPDALLGAAAYLLEAVVGAVGGRARWRTMPWVVLLLGVIACGLALGGVLLALSQPIFFHAYCTLCLASALCSILMVGFVISEVRATLHFLKRESERGCSAWRALWGEHCSVDR